MVWIVVLVMIFVLGLVGSMMIFVVLNWFLMVWGIVFLVMGILISVCVVCLFVFLMFGGILFVFL